MDELDRSGVQIYAADHPRDPAIYPAALEMNTRPLGVPTSLSDPLPEDAIVDDDVLGTFYRDPGNLASQSSF